MSHLHLSQREVLVCVSQEVDVMIPIENQTHISQLIDLLGDADPDVRQSAALAIGEAQAPEAAAALVARFGVERDFYIRETLTWSALRVREAALPHVYTALDSLRWLARLQAAHTLSKIANPADAARLVPLISDPVDAVAVRAYAAAALTGEPRVLPALVAQLARGDAEQRNSLTVALGSYGKAAVPALVDALREESPAVRLHAADTLSHLGSPGADGAALALTETLADPDAGVRLAALNALGQLAVPFAWRVVDATTAHPEPLMRGLAERLARRRPKPRRIAVQRRAAEPVTGVIAAAPGALVELRCESEFTARSPTFQALAQRVADLAATSPPDTAADLAGTPTSPSILSPTGGTLADDLAALAEATGETVAIGRVARLPGRTTAHLRRTAAGLPPRVGALVAYEGESWTDEVAPRIALQVAVSGPRYVAREDVPAEVLARLRADAVAEARKQGRPDQLADRIAAGRVEQFLHETVLLEQVSVADPGRTVAGLLTGRGVRITGFVRLEVGVPPGVPSGS